MSASSAGGDTVEALRVGAIGGWLEREDARDEVFAALDGAGALLLRGDAPLGAEGVARACDLLGLSALPTADDFAPREELGNGVLGAPHWPGDREMCPHHERGHSVTAPSIVLLSALQVAPTGGQTVLADTQDVLRRIPDGVRETLTETGWLSVRTYRPFFGVNWPQMFGTDDPVAVEDLLAELGWEAEWRRDGALRTAGRRPAVLRHPRTGQESWWGQLTFFNQWALDEAERELLISSFGVDALPFNTSRGDGTPLTQAEFEAVLAAYEPSSRTVEWTPSDLLIVDNIRTAHGRRPHAGTRTMAVAPCETFSVRAADPRSLSAPGGHIG